MKQITEEQVREWYGRMRDGGAAGSFNPDRQSEELAVVFAIARRMNGMGVDRTDPLGEDARSLVDRVLDGPASEEFKG